MCVLYGRMRHRTQHGDGMLAAYEVCGNGRADFRLQAQRVHILVAGLGTTVPQL